MGVEEKSLLQGRLGGCPSFPGVGWQRGGRNLCWWHMPSPPPAFHVGREGAELETGKGWGEACPGPPKVCLGFCKKDFCIPSDPHLKVLQEGQLDLVPTAQPRHNALLLRGWREGGGLALGKVSLRGGFSKVTLEILKCRQTSDTCGTKGTPKWECVCARLRICS